MSLAVSIRSLDHCGVFSRTQILEDGSATQPCVSFQSRAGQISAASLRRDCLKTAPLSSRTYTVSWAPPLASGVPRASVPVPGSASRP